MQTVHWLFVAAIPVVAGCASFPPDQSIDASILAQAKDRASPYCGKIADGCEYTLSKSSDGWVVHIIPIYFSTEGRRAYAIDGDDMYFYDRKGRFNAALRGY